MQNATLIYRYFLINFALILVVALNWSQMNISNGKKKKMRVMRLPGLNYEKSLPYL